MSSLHTSRPTSPRQSIGCLAFVDHSDRGDESRTSTSGDRVTSRAQAPTPVNDNITEYPGLAPQRTVVIAGPILQPTPSLQQHQKRAIDPKHGFFTYYYLCILRRTGKNISAALPLLSIRYVISCVNLARRSDLEDFKSCFTLYT